MIHICAITKNHEFVSNLSLEDVHEQYIDWFWVDFFQPNEEEHRII